MQLYNIKHPEQEVSFKEAVLQGLGKDQGLFLPKDLKPLPNLGELLSLPFIPRSVEILHHLIGDEISKEDLSEIVSKAFIMPAIVVPVNQQVSCLELFHGPTLAFKDFGGRFMSQVLSHITQGQKITILTATSGDTGAAVAHAFYGIDNIKVVVLYPKGKISLLQEQLFCTLGDNISTLAIEGDFDACQALVKEAFNDLELKEAIGLNSANSINISRLLAQVCYYFEAFVQLTPAQQKNLVVSVPSGNFGNLTAGVIAKVLGLPIKRFVAATNSNDTVPRFLTDGKWDVKATIATISNAMDVSNPNNWPRIEEIFATQGWSLAEIAHGFLDEPQTKHAVYALKQQNYLSEPHGAIAYQILVNNLQPDEYGLFLGTAHPAKFKEVVDEILNIKLVLPTVLATHLVKENLSVTLPASYAAMKTWINNNIK